MKQRLVRVLVVGAFAAFVLCGATIAVADESDTSTPVLISAPDTATPAPLTVRLEDDDNRVVLRGTWTYRWDKAASGASMRTSVRAGSSATVRFDGTGIALVAPVGPAAGIARITLDGAAPVAVSLYASQAAAPAPVWSATGLEPGRHTLVVTVSGAADPFSAGKTVTIDAFDIEGKALAAATTGRVVQHTDSRLYRKGAWRTRSSGNASGGSAMYARTSGTAVTVRFKGTGIVWRGRKTEQMGLAEVLLDGKRVATVGGAPGPSRERIVIWAASGLANREHTLVVRALGRPSGLTASAETAVDVDAFVVTGTVLQAYRPTPFKYPWKTYIVIDKSDFKLYWVKNGMLVKAYPIAHGKVGWSTPERVWKILAKYHSSGVYGPRKMRLFKEVKSGSRTYYVHTAYGIHGTNQEWVIGTRASHGCIRMYNKDVLELFPQVPMGTMVVTRD